MREFDIGWVYIRLLSAVRLARVRYARNVSASEFAERYYRKRQARRRMSVRARVRWRSGRRRPRAKS